MILDIICLIAVILAMIKGAKDGLVISVVSFLSIFIGMVGALKFSNIIKDFLINSLGWESASIPLLSFAAAFVLAVLLARAIAHLATKFFNAVFLGFFNRLLGAFFQVLIAVLVGSVFLSIFDEVNKIFYFISEESLMKSTSFKVYLFLSEDILPSLYDLVRHLFSKSIDLLQEMKAEESL